MFENKTETQARAEILNAVKEYCNTFHNEKKKFEPGDRITYASRVYDNKEMCNLVDAALEFWLTSGSYTVEFEKKFAEYLGLKYCSLVNSGSSANLLAFMALTSPLLGERQVKPGDEMITVRSMTSFGRSSSEEGEKRVFTVEMKSVNSRYLDVNIRMPKTLISLEEEIRKMISNSLNRGKVDVFINLKNYNDGSGIPKVDINLAQGYLNCLKEIEAKLGVKNDISVMQIARFPEVVTIVEEEDKIEVVWQELKPLISDSLEMMTKMREVEGDKLKEDILSKISIIEQLVLKVEEFADTIPKAFKLKLEERVKELLGNIDIDENRIAMEVCMLADKATVDEEIIRLRSHISQVRETLNLKEPVGRKLDFIVQEMNRETNTIGSKSSDIQMTNIVIDIKNILEKIREQVQNIE